MTEKIDGTVSVNIDFQPACSLFVTDGGGYSRSIPFNPELPETDIKCPTGASVSVSAELGSNIGRNDESKVTVVCRGCNWRNTGYVSEIMGRIE
jgi:hypothetical protein